MSPRLALLALLGLCVGQVAAQYTPPANCPLTDTTFPCELLGKGSGTFGVAPNTLQVAFTVELRQISVGLAAFPTLTAAIFCPVSVHRLPGPSPSPGASPPSSNVWRIVVNASVSPVITNAIGPVPPQFCTRVATRVLPNRQTVWELTGHITAGDPLACPASFEDGDAVYTNAFQPSGCPANGCPGLSSPASLPWAALAATGAATAAVAALVAGGRGG